MRQTHVALIALAFSFGPELPAQEARRLPLGKLEPGQVVRVRFAGGDRIESRLLSVQPDSLALSVEGASVRLATSSLDSLWVKGRATMTGAFVGAAIGAVGSVVMSAMVCSAIREDFPCGESGTAIAASIAGSAGLGAAIGFVIPTWRLRFARHPVLGAPLTGRTRVSFALSITLP